MKNRKREKKKWASQPAARPKPASPAHSPACCSPARPSSLPTAAARWTPHVSRIPIHSVVSLTHASTAYATGARQRWQGGPGGHTRGMACLPCAALMQPHASRLMHRMPLHRSIAARHGSMELGYKTPASDARALSCAPPPPCGRPQHTRAKREEGEEEEGGGTPKPLRGGRACRSRRNRGRRHRPHHGRGSARHCFWSYMATTRHYTAILSPTTPTVSLPVSPCSPLNLTMSAMALHTGSALTRAVSGL